MALPVLGVAEARFWADGDPAPIAAYLARVRSRQGGETAKPLAGPLAGPSAAPPLSGPPTLRPAHYLALSGGADNGAFGAGVLVGWTEAGTRPRFDVVTGVSAGALIAPFAFLGPAYDDRLAAVFTEVAPGDVFRLGGVAFALLFGEALADTSPLARLIERHADARLMADVAAEHARGRLLLVGTTNIDLGRPVVWNLGALAASGRPEALELVRRVLLASASVPGAFPPVLIDVEGPDGRRYQEMHVDGGAATQVFLYPPGLDPREGWRRVGTEGRERTAWVVRNGRVDVTGAERPPSGLFTVAARSAQTLLHYAGVADIQRIHLTALRDGIAFRLQSIGPDFAAPHAGFFDPAYMRALFAYGRARGRDARSWATAPPPVGVIVQPPPPPPAPGG